MCTQPLHCTVLDIVAVQWNAHQNQYFCNGTTDNQEPGLKAHYAIVPICCSLLYVDLLAVPCNQFLHYVT